MKSTFVGDSSLLIRCADRHLTDGHSISAIVTRDADIRLWAEKRDIIVFEKDWLLANATLPSACHCDILFSIANLDMLPARLLNAAKLAAVNFHDGPLPRYAGLNATSWALLNGERTHGVTWHEMQSGPDTGGIIAQAAIEIEVDETAASLNAKCYETGYTLFGDVLTKLVAGNVSVRNQQGERTYFARHKRPHNMGLLDPAGSAAAALSTIRSLNTGTYANPLGKAKLWIGSQVVCVGQGDDTGNTSSRQGLIVPFADRALVLSQLVTPNAQPLDETALEVLRSATPRSLEPALSDTINAIATEAARSDTYWIGALQNTELVELPYKRVGPNSATAENREIRRRVECMQLDDEPEARVSLLLASICAWCAKLTGKTDISVQVQNATTCAKVAGVEPVFSAWRPVSLSTKPGMSVRDLRRSAANVWDDARERGPVATDLATRMGAKELSASPLISPNIALSVGVQTAVTAPGNLDLLFHSKSGSELDLVCRADQFDEATLDLMATHFAHVLRQTQAMRSQDKAVTVGDLCLVPEGEAEIFERANSATARADLTETLENATIVSRIDAQALKTPNRVALRQRERAVTYAQLVEESQRLAEQLRGMGAGGNGVVGVCLDHEPDLVVALLAIMRCGAGYLPLDPAYPADRLRYMLEDSKTQIVLVREASAPKVSEGETTYAVVDVRKLLRDAPRDVQRNSAAAPGSLAYLIYTSGSTGRPKGVQLTHRNVVNFFAGMDELITIEDHENPGVWLSVTTASFDISVLELLWTLTRGFEVAMHTRLAPSRPRHQGQQNVSGVRGHAPSFSLFYFGNAPTHNDKNPYHVMLEGAKFADENGFEAVWTPERHFHAFGGLYPNPAVTGAAIAATTARIQIRAGSCVAPLHHPARIAEDWSIIDNISGGRTGIAFASGWNPNDFVFRPYAFADAKQHMIATARQVNALWRGETVAFEGPNGDQISTATLPRPQQATLPTWLTAARNPDTFRVAGEMGFNVLTHMLGMSLDDVASNIRVYRKAWKDAGHAGEGRVTLMLHTFVGDDMSAIRDTVRGPMKTYLAGAVDLVRSAAWSFPTITSRATASGQSPSEVFDEKSLTPEEQDALLEHAFDRYFETSGLFGTPEHCLTMVQRTAAIGVDEIACLIDFGVDAQTTLDHLPNLKALMELAATSIETPMQERTVGEDLVAYGATHLQCTPSMATMLASDPKAEQGLQQLTSMLVGGEALAVDLAKRLRSVLRGQLLNMYGPTETTIWSSVANLEQIGSFVPLGEAIVNTELRIVTPSGDDCPAMVAGELCIGGEGVSKGYWKRPQLNAERFIEYSNGKRYYRTGDLVRRHTNGALEFLGRIDQQVKIRGHRIELGEIQNAIEQFEAVDRAIVVAKSVANDQRLVGYYKLTPGSQLDSTAIGERLAQSLPEIMLPSQIIRVDAFPSTPNGKIDVKALPDIDATPCRVAEAPQNDTQQQIAKIWCELIGTEQIDLDANFFDVGGHSLLAVQVQRRISEDLGAEITITDMFRFPTIRQLSQKIALPQPQQNLVARGTDRAQRRLRSRRSQRMDA